MIFAQSPQLWGAHAPSRVGDGAIAIADFSENEIEKIVSARRRDQHARARALPSQFQQLIDEFNRFE